MASPASGQLWSLGVDSSDTRLLGLGSLVTETLVFKKLTFTDNKIVHFSLGDKHAAAADCKEE